MDRKKLIKLGISVLAVNALGAVAVYKYPELTHVPTVYAEEQPGEDEEIPDASEAQAAANFKNQMDEFEKAINEFNPDDSGTILLQLMRSRVKKERKALPSMKLVTKP